MAEPILLLHMTSFRLMVSQQSHVENLYSDELPEPDIPKATAVAVYFESGEKDIVFVGVDERATFSSEEYEFTGRAVSYDMIPTIKYMMLRYMTGLYLHLTMRKSLLILLCQVRLLLLKEQIREMNTVDLSYLMSLMFHLWMAIEFGDHLQWFDVQDYITEEDETFAKVNITPVSFLTGWDTSQDALVEYTHMDSWPGYSILGGLNYRIPQSVQLDEIPPTITSLYIDTSIPKNGDTIQCLVDFFDIVDDQHDVIFTWYHNEDIVQNGNELVVDNYTVGDAITCRDIVDSDGNQVTQETSTEVYNTTYINRSRYLPTKYVLTPEILCKHYDPDLQELELTYKWFINEVIQEEYSNTLTNVFVVGEEFHREVEISDGLDFGESLSTSTTIKNTPPVISDLRFLNDAARHGDTQKCLFQAYDLDNDVSVYWFVNIYTNIYFKMKYMEIYLY